MICATGSQLEKYEAGGSWGVGRLNVVVVGGGDKTKECQEVLICLSEFQVCMSAAGPEEDLDDKVADQDDGGVGDCDDDGDGAVDGWIVRMGVSL